MTPEEKSNTFKEELSYIKNNSVREFTTKAIEIFPEYFFTIPASTSKRYHPSFAAGTGGLVRHTKAAVRVAKELFRLEMFDQVYSDIDKDIIISSLILHDGNKAGSNGEHTVANHPLLMSKFLLDKKLSGILDNDVLEKIQKNISRHMGQWIHDYKTGEKILEKPFTKMEKFVHMCDYIASRKCMEINLDAPLSK
jgi:hypothetical protein